MDHEQREQAFLWGCIGVFPYRFRLANKDSADGPTKWIKGRGDTQMHQPGSP
jgi:hypothetical protein